MITLFMCGTHFHISPLNFPLVTDCMSNFVLHQTQMGGSEILRGVYYIGCPQTADRAYIHLLSLRSLQNFIFELFLLILRILPLEPLGPEFSTVQNLSLFSGFVLVVWCISYSLINVYPILILPLSHNLASNKISSMYQVKGL